MNHVLVEATLFQIGKEVMLSKLLPDLEDYINMRLASIFYINENVVQVYYNKDV